MPRRTSLRLLALLALGPLLAAGAHAQGSLDVTFRFLPDLTPPPIEPVERAFVPGSFNDWGPNTDGQISPGAPSQMTYVEAEDEYRYTIALAPGEHFYKIHYHRNGSGTDYEWITDPLAQDPCTYGQFGSDCRVEVADPMAFQLARERNAGNEVFAVSAGLFGSQDFTSIEFQIGDGPLQDGLPFFDDATGLFRYELPAPVPAPGYFRLRATDALGRTVEDAVGFVPPDVVDRARPTGLPDGITYVNDTTVRLSLFAPQKSFVHVIGEFNDWTADDNSLLFRDADGADPFTTDSLWWWIEIDGLTPGEEYAFQYLVDGELRVTDPYVEKVLHPFDDDFIPEVTYPNLKPYPEGQREIVGVLQPGKPDYDWQSDGYERPALEDLVIYELLVRDFIERHDYQTLVDTLDYLDRLGVTAIELMPVSEFDGNINWGYAPAFVFAPDKFYGPEEELKRFIDECHLRGIAVLLDVVYNHATGQSPLIRLYNEGDYGPPTPDNPWANPTARHPFNVFYDLNHESAATQHWLDRVNAHWIEEYRVDGYRFDLSKGFVQTCNGGICTDGNWSQYNPGRIALLKRMADQIWDVDDETYVVLEHFAANNEEQELAAYGRDQGLPGMLLWHNLNRPYSQAAMGYLNDGGFSSDLSSTYPPNRGMPVTGLVTYMESHDEQWLMYRLRAYGPQEDDYDVRELNTAVHRLKLAASFFLTVPGPRMIWQFGELGYGWGESGEQCLREAGDDCPPEAPGRTDPKPIRWDYQDDWRRDHLYQVYDALLRLRNDYNVFTSPDTEVDLSVGQGNPGRRIKLSLDGTQVVILGNFGLEERAVFPEFHQTGTWYEFFTDEEIEVTNTNDPFILKPGEARIYSTVDFPSPPAGIYAVPVEDDTRPVAFRLDGPAPNPFSTATTLAFAVPEPGDVQLEVFDLLGRRVAVLVSEPLPAGSYRAELSAAGLPSGVYVVRLAAAGQSATTKLTLTR
ncbi:MAG: alpha-amylase family glycosyl hydrolase [Rubricoccaceae bacterium]|nr:alpha-amylase family glycosyl hydrolase [Rubricoccaceae bacterium]